jgi:hypothetical protein
MRRRVGSETEEKRFERTSLKKQRQGTLALLLPLIVEAR